jgi:hypothetical protein
MECARSMIFAQGLELEFWGEVVNTAVYIKNRCPTKALDFKTPQEAWSGRKLDVCRAPKFLVDPLDGPSMRQCGRSWNLEHDPDFQH